MKLLELTGIKNLSDKEITDIITELIKKKYKLLGVGMCGVAFDNPKKPNEVIKFWFNDPGYEHFLDIAHTIKSPHIIKVIKRGSITLNLDTPIIVKYARLEKLEYATEVDGINIDNFVFLVSQTLEVDNGRDFIEQIYQLVNDNRNSIVDFMDFKEFSKDTIECIHVIKKLSDTSAQSSFIFVKNLSISLSLSNDSLNFLICFIMIIF
jgi:hypothetical protein